MKTIALTRGHVALVDDEDFERLSAHKWYAFKNKQAWYVARASRSDGRRRTVYMHREVLPAAPGLVVDHIDGDGLNNCRSNLRVCTKAENNRNRRYSGRACGVAYNRAKKKWEAYVQVNRKQHYVGLFLTQEEAVEARDAKARELHGEFATCQRTRLDSLPRGGAR